MEPDYQDTDTMNPLELACAKGNEKMVRYLVNDLNLRSKYDFCLTHKIQSLEDMSFIYVPLMNQNLEMVKFLLSLAHFGPTTSFSRY